MLDELNNKTDYLIEKDLLKYHRKLKNYKNVLDQKLKSESVVLNTT